MFTVLTSLVSAIRVRYGIIVCQGRLWFAGVAQFPFGKTVRKLSIKRDLYHHENRNPYNFCDLDQSGLNARSGDCGRIF